MKFILLCGVAAWAGVLGFFGLFESKAKGEDLRIGVYDSRAIAVAYAHSKIFDDLLAAKLAERKEAKAKGDLKRVAELEQLGNQQQQKMHLQGFGTAPVDDLLVYINADMPGIAADANVCMIVSKWQIDYKDKSAVLVDVTDAMVKKFEPKNEQQFQRAMKIIEGLKNWKPFSEEEILKHKD